MRTCSRRCWDSSRRPRNEAPGVIVRGKKGQLVLRLPFLFCTARPPFTILGYRGLAMLLFLAAAAGGVWMAWAILSHDVRTRISGLVIGAITIHDLPRESLRALRTLRFKSSLRPLPAPRPPLRRGAE